MLQTEQSQTLQQFSEEPALTPPNPCGNVFLQAIHGGGRHVCFLDASSGSTGMLLCAFQPSACLRFLLLFTPLLLICAAIINVFFYVSVFFPFNVHP